MPTPARISVLLAALLAVSPLLAASPSAPTPREARAIEQMRALQAEMGHDKRAFVDHQLQLSPEDAARFWPVYDAHQVALAELNRRRLDNILAYARAWNAGSLDDATASSLGKEALDIEKDEAALMKRTFGAASKAIRPAKAARYLQVEAKIRALVRYERRRGFPSRNSRQSEENEMKPFALTATAALMLAACASTPDVRTDADPGVHFGSYHTYTWLQTPKQGSPLMQQRIFSAIDGTLASMGWTRVPAPAVDVATAANLATQKEHSIDTFYTGPAWRGWGWRGPAASTSTTVRSYTVGTLVVDMFDTRTRQAIWRGTASGTVPKSPEQVNAALQASIDKMFTGFPTGGGDRNRGNFGVEARCKR